MLKTKFQKKEPKTLRCDNIKNITNKNFQSVSISKLNSRNSDEYCF